jgi:hypothetical protein
MRTKMLARAALAAICGPAALLALVACSGSAPSSTGSPGLTANAAKAVDAAIEVYADCSSPSVEPKVIILACADGGAVLQDIRWTSWTSTRATGLATFVYNDCSPSCAAGHFRKVAGTTVTLTDPVRGASGRLVWSRLQQSPEPPGYQTGPLHGGPYPLPTQPE